MEALRIQHKKQIDELQDKLQWYADNQELLNSNSDLIKEQASTILSLKQKLEAAKGKRLNQRASALCCSNRRHADPLDEKE